MGLRDASARILNRVERTDREESAESGGSLNVKWKDKAAPMREPETLSGVCHEVDERGQFVRYCELHLVGEVPQG